LKAKGFGQEDLSSGFFKSWFSSLGGSEGGICIEFLNIGFGNVI
jgi:hypothetical protein